MASLFPLLCFYLHPAPNKIHLSKSTQSELLEMQIGSCYSPSQHLHCFPIPFPSLQGSLQFGPCLVLNLNSYHVCHLHPRIPPSPWLLHPDYIAFPVAPEIYRSKAFGFTFSSVWNVIFLNRASSLTFFQAFSQMYMQRGFL